MVKSSFNILHVVNSMSTPTCVDSLSMTNSIQETFLHEISKNFETKESESLENCEMWSST